MHLFQSFQYIRIIVVFNYCNTANPVFTDNKILNIPTINSHELTIFIHMSSERTQWGGDDLRLFYGTEKALPDYSIVRTNC